MSADAATRIVSTRGQNDPEGDRIRARLRSYSNALDEEAAVAAVDAAHFEDARALEGMMANQAREMILADEHVDGLLGDANAVHESVMEDLYIPLGNGAALDEPTAELYLRSEARVAKTVAALRARADALDAYADRAADPWDAWRNLIQRFPAIKGRPSGTPRSAH